MLECRNAVVVRFLLVACVAGLPWVAGCESHENGAAASAKPPLDQAQDRQAAADQMNPTLTVAASSSATKPRVPLRPGAKTKVLAAAGNRSYDKTFDDLRFEMTVGEEFKRSMLTPQIEAMAGQKIRIRGYILPTAQRNGIKQFVLVRDNQECCFGPGAALYDCILVEMKPGKTAEYSIRPVAAEGTFDVKEVVIGGKHLAIYHMDGENVGGS
jgi:hypothetical protein